MTDPHAVNGKIAAAETHYGLIVIGAGPAGLGAAIAAAEAGHQVLLVDENPVPASQAGTDVPLWFGGRATAALGNRERMVEQVFMAEPLLERAFALGVDVRLGTMAWGLYRNRANLAALPQAQLGLADGEHSWMVGFDRLILATGARDFALAFAGWDQPGVMGALALQTLLTRYDAFAGRRVVILGSGDLALHTAQIALTRGVDVAALIEVRDQAQGNPAVVAELVAAGVALHRGTNLIRADGAIDGVTGAVIAPRNGGAEQVIACDTICLAIDSVPAIELADVAGARIVSAGTAGGVVAVRLDGSVGEGEILPGIWTTGAVAGRDAPRADVEAAGAAIARAAFGLVPVPDNRRGEPGFDRLAYRAEWTRALVAVTPDDVAVCICEEVSRADLIGVQPPRYLPRGERIATRSLATLLDDGPPDQEQVKRLTRACMGACQARRCREQVSLLLGMAANLTPEMAPRAAWRAPVRPLPLALLADTAEGEAMGEGWDVWFGIPTQWIPYRDIGTDRERQHHEALGGNMHL